MRSVPITFDANAQAAARPSRLAVGTFGAALLLAEIGTIHRFRAASAIVHRA